MIFYLCTSQIVFAPLKSVGKSRSRTPEEREQYHPPRPSPKSMYRLADKVSFTMSLTGLDVELITVAAIAWFGQPMQIGSVKHPIADIKEECYS
jgi:hypothetical protein